jgi:hypothetical protein
MEAISGPERYAGASATFWRAIEERAGSRKGIASALRQGGRPTSEQAVGSWVRGEYEADLATVLWASEQWGVSLDEFVSGEALEVKLSDRMARAEQENRRLGRQLAFLTATLHKLAQVTGHAELFGPQPEPDEESATRAAGA